MMGARYVARLIATTLFETPFPHPRQTFMLMLGIAAQESKLRYLRQLGGGPARASCAGSCASLLRAVQEPTPQPP